MTDKEIVQALRCTSTPGSLHEDFTGCPYYRKEKLDAEKKKKLGVDTWPSCDVNKVGMDAADLIERLTAENAELREKPRWIPVTERMPEERVLVNVVWVNRAPEPYYERIKNVPFSGTACFYRENWYWDSPVVLDMLAEYGEDASDLVDEAVEITNWMPLPEAPEEEGKA